MADPRGIAINISSRRPVYTDDPEYDKLLLALHAEQPDALQADELAHVQTLLPANFQSQNDPVADRARLGVPDGNPYTSTLEQFLGRQAPVNLKQAVENTVFAPAVNAVSSVFGALDRPPTSGYPKGVPYTSPLRLISAAGAAVPATVGVLYDLLRGVPTPAEASVVDPMRAPEDQATFQSETAKRGGGTVAQTLGTLADLFVGPEHGLQAVGAALPLVLGAGKMAKAVRMSRAEAEAAGLWHKIGLGKKLSRPISEMSFTQEAVGKLLPPATNINLSDLEGAAIIPASGDRTAAGRQLTQIGDIKFETPVALQGGPDFMRTHTGEGAVWASDFGATKKIVNKAIEAGDLGDGRVYMVYMPMAHGATDFSAMMSDALLEQIKQTGISRDGRRFLDETIRKMRPEWVGINSPNAKKQLSKSGELRHAFVESMKTQAAGGYGFPDLTTTRAAITEPSLLDTTAYSGGQSVGEVIGRAGVITEPVTPHGTYNTQIPGRYTGKFAKDVPLQTLFPDFIKGRRAERKDPTKDLRSFMLSNPIQIATPQWIDSNMKYLKAMGAVVAPVAANSVLDAMQDDDGTS